MKDSGPIFGVSDSPCAHRGVKAPSLIRCCLIIICLLLVGVSLFSLPIPLSFVAARQIGLQNDGQGYAPLQIEKRKVPLEVHIESRCPDARDCLQKLVVPAYWHVKDEAFLKLSYVGEIWEQPRKDVTCQHGWNECDGNRMLVCAERYAKSPSHTLGFTNCVLSDYERVPQPDLIKECALEHDINYNEIETCASAQEGRDLLIESVQRSVDAKSNFSCTVRVDNEEWCVRDDYMWKCDRNHYTVQGLVDEIRKLSARQQKP